MSACESVTPPRSGGMYSLCLLPQTQLVTSYRQFVWMPKNVTATSTVTDTGIWYSYSGNTIFAVDFGVFKHVRVLLCRVFSHFFSCLFWMLSFSCPSKVYIWGLCRNLEYKGIARRGIDPQCVLGLTGMMQILDPYLSTEGSAPEKIQWIGPLHSHSLPYIITGTMSSSTSSSSSQVVVALSLTLWLIMLAVTLAC